MERSDRFSRTFRHLAAAAALAALVAPAPGASGETAESPRRVRSLAGAESPPATLEAADWLSGHWIGEGLGGVSEEIWSPPAGGAMMGAYRLLREGRPVFYEFLLLVEERGSLVLKLKHFHPDLTGWEEKGDFVDFPLVAVEEGALHFDGLTFARGVDGDLAIFLLLRDRATGAEREERFLLRRAP